MSLRVRYSNGQLSDECFGCSLELTFKQLLVLLGAEISEQRSSRSTIYRLGEDEYMVPPSERSDASAIESVMVQMLHANRGWDIFPSDLSDADLDGFVERYVTAMDGTYSPNMVDIAEVFADWFGVSGDRVSSSVHRLLYSGRLRLDDRFNLVLGRID